MSSIRTQFTNSDRPRPAAETEGGRTPSPIDLHVGLRIRMRRKTLGVSQERLADELGLTFQQVQKYERGANRVSASKLYETARALEISVGWFFEGLAETAGDDATPVGPDPVLIMMGAPYGAQVATDYGRLTHLDRSIVAGLVRRLADGAGDLPTAALTAGMGAGELGSGCKSLDQLRRDELAAKAAVAERRLDGHRGQAA